MGNEEEMNIQNFGQISDESLYYYTIIIILS